MHWDFSHSLQATLKYVFMLLFTARRPSFETRRSRGDAAAADVPREDGSRGRRGRDAATSRGGRPRPRRGSSDRPRDGLSPPPKVGLSQVHWSACLLRLLTLLACDFGDGPHDKNGRVDSDLRDDGCPNTVLTTAYNWGDGVWATYIEAAVWANMALNGEASYRLHSEGVLGICIMLMGFILLGFLLGELTNTMTNLDPVGNQFRQTRDALTEFMAKHQFSSGLRHKLKEYITLSEPIFRENHYGQILTMLSPRFRHIVANNVSGYLVTQVPFIRYATQCAAGIKEGSELWIDFEGSPRKCKVTHVVDYLTYDIVYLDSGQREFNVSHDRVDVQRSVPSRKEKIFRLGYEQDSLVVKIAHHFEAQLYMARDTVILRDMSVNESLYVVEVGNVMVFGAASARQFRCNTKKGTQYFGDDVAMLLCGDRRPKLVHYSVKTTEVTQLKVLPGKVFVELLKTPSFNMHHELVKRYGCWLLLRQAVIRKVRKWEWDNTRQQHALGSVVSRARGTENNARLKLKLGVRPSFVSADASPAEQLAAVRAARSGGAEDDRARRFLLTHFAARFAARGADAAALEAWEAANPTYGMLCRQLYDVLRDSPRGDGGEYSDESDGDDAPS